MTRTPSSAGDLPDSIRVPVLVVAAGALLAGLYGRFKGIGTWPLGVDEFYISRSIDNVLRSGLPRFSCGGYYTRGLAYQYLVAGLRLLGPTPEFAGRAVAGISSLAMLPAAYLLGKRIQSSLAGWLTVIILCVSIWEIEMARFARMYAPFQAVFTWYAVFYLRYTMDKERAALGWMIALSVLGALTWEGGALQGLANVFAILLAHEHGRLKRADGVRLFGMVALLALLILSTRDFRGFTEPSLPDAGGPASHLQFVAAWLAPLRQHPGWAGGLLLPVGLACASLRWIWSYRRQWLAAAGLFVALAAAAAHCFIVTGGVLALMLFARLIDWHELTGYRARYFLMALASFLVFWLAFGHWVGGVPAGANASAVGTAAPPLVRYLFGFPDIYDEVVRPWGRALPILSAALLVAIAFFTWTTLGARRNAAGTMEASLGLILLMVLAVGATHTPYLETRYTFFLYPLLIALGVAAVLTLVRRLKVLAHAPMVLCAVIPLLCFSATEDFQPKHLVEVDSAKINFRVGMSPADVAQYYPRSDVRALGRWLAAHVRKGDVVVTGIPSLDQYYDRVDYFFLEKGEGRYEAYVCPDGRTERWSNHPLLYTENALSPIVASGRRVFATVYPDAEARLFATAQLHGWSVTRAWTTIYGNVDILLIVAKSGAASVK